MLSGTGAGTRAACAGCLGPSVSPPCMRRAGRSASGTFVRVCPRAQAGGAFRGPAVNGCPERERLKDQDAVGTAGCRQQQGRRSAASPGEPGPGEHSVGSCARAVCPITKCCGPPKPPSAWHLATRRRAAGAAQSLWQHPCCWPPSASRRLRHPASGLGLRGWWLVKPL